ncbi:MAG: HAD-IG family 5'-nucleotidase [Deltaproteobacteria bacterium]|nr:HAD-IG family 5'-nucleotidase [Deltaproteobacteria bacterium]
MSLAFQPPIDRTRHIFCNRTLNLRAIKAIGYDMDYTLIHYHVDVWERRAYEHARQRLAVKGWPVGDLVFDGSLVSRALVIDKELGNLVKADRFGFVKTAAHGTKMLDYPELRERYYRTVVDLRDSRWEFLNTLFSISVGCLYGQCVDLLDNGQLPLPMGYPELFKEVQRALDLTHIEGELKAEIIRDPTAFVDLDPDLPAALQDQRDAGKKLVLITNSEWSYTDAMMRWVFEQQLGLPSWRALFDMIIVQARKPDFFLGTSPAYEIINENGDLRPLPPPQKPVAGEGRLYYGGNAGLVESALGLQGADILYVGDHIFADVHASKRTVRWRTALVLRELEDDIRAIDGFRADEAKLGALMRDKTALEERVAVLRLELMRRRAGRASVVEGSQSEIELEIERVKGRLSEVDQAVSPLAEAAATVPHPRWGAIMRAGIDKSHIARQIERYADIYLSRVSNFLWATPSAYFRSPKSSLPHDT